jgi:hypothetical protein
MENEKMKKFILQENASRPDTNQPVCLRYIVILFFAKENKF